MQPWSIPSVAVLLNRYLTLLSYALSIIAFQSVWPKPVSVFHYCSSTAKAHRGFQLYVQARLSTVLPGVSKL
jgi:hypothetical protein